jgi:WD40 repeat protein/DNA-binding SARP family transcriptional activator
LDFRLLGPLEVVGDGGLEISVGSGRQRILLALLALRANELVATDRLVEDLWGESPPPTAHKMLHNQVSALRQALGRNGRLETQGSAYRLNVAPGERDIDRFEELVARGRDELEADPERAAEALREALALWRGPPLSDLAYEPFAQTEIARLEERRWAAFEARVEAELALGRHADLVPELEAAVAEQPLRERLHGQLMLALYRSGRQADALEAYRRARTTLVEEVGVEPGAELRALQDAILAQDPVLDTAADTQELPPALEGGSPVLAGRERELAELIAVLTDACEGRGGSVLVSGRRGMGKTRLAAELAREGLRRGMVVLYTGAGAQERGALATLVRAERGERPALLIVDDLDHLSAEVLDRAAALGEKGGGLLLLGLHRGPDPPGAFAAASGRRLELGPVGPEAVAQIARLYFPADTASLPVEELVESSRGVPLAVHWEAAEWVRRRTSAEIAAGADRAAAERGDLRAAEDALSDDLVSLRTVDELRRLYGSEDEGAPLPAVCPFLGLATFDAAHAEYFFGRERLVAELVARLVGSPLLALVGSSGSGKSSALRAGLLPALTAGVLPGSERWARRLLRPGTHPMAELEGALSDLDERAVLAVDQFEEVFTLCRDEHERTRFLDALVELAEDPKQRTQVVIAMRADFYGRCGTHDRLARLVGANQVLVGPMRRDELRRAIEQPARRVGLSVEPELTDALIADVLDEPGGLPLLSAALLEQWQERDGRVMRHAGYERTGGVRGAVGRLAEQTYAQLSEGEQEAARRILLRLADADEQESVFVRRRMPLDEIDPEPDAQTAAALTALIDSRLVTVEEESLEVAHEALLREWPRLRTWLEEDAEGRRLHQHLIHAARDWDAAGRDPGELYRGARLASALEWRAAHEGDPNELEREFLDNSRADAEYEAERQQRTNRRLRLLLAGLGALLGLALVAGVLALNQRGEARDAALTADAQRLGAEALTQERLDQALLRARASVQLDESPATLGNLLSVLMRTPAAIGVVNLGWPIYGTAISPDGSVIATGDERGTVIFYDAASRKPLGRPYEIDVEGAGLIQNVRFSPDGRTLAASSMDPDNPEHNGIVDLIDVRSRERLLRLRLPPLDQPPNFVYVDVMFLPNGRDLLARQVHGSGANALAEPLYRVDRETGAVRDRLELGHYTSDLYASATADRRRIFLTSPREQRTWEVDAQGLRVLRSWPVGDHAGAVSPDGRVFALGSEDGRVRLLDLGSGAVHPFRGRHDGDVIRMRFTPDGRTLVTSGGDGGVLAWDVERRTVDRQFAGHTREVHGLDMTADGRTLFTGSSDTRAILWDLAGDRRLDRRFAIGRSFDLFSTPRGIAVSPDGRALALTHSDGAVDLIDTRTLRRRRTIRATKGAAASIDFSPDGRLLAVTGEGGRVTLWNTRTLAPAGELRGMGVYSQALAFSPDGTLLAAAEGEVTPNTPQPPIRVWDVRRRALTRFDARGFANSIAFSPDGNLIATAEGPRGTGIRDARLGTLVKRFRMGDLAAEGDFSRSVAFSPDGRLLFIGQYDGTGRLFSTETWRPVGRPLEGHTARITFPQFAPDGRTLVTAGADGTVVLWDVATHKPIGSPLQLGANIFTSAALSPDGSRLFAISTRDEGISFDMSPEAWKRHACLVAGRDFTAREWEEALPEQPYQTVCSGD